MHVIMMYHTPTDSNASVIIERNPVTGHYLTRAWTDLYDDSAHACLRTFETREEAQKYAREFCGPSASVLLDLRHLDTE